LEGAINEAIIKENDGSGCIQSGCKIKILFGGEQMEYEVVAPSESDILKSKISYQSPLGQALLGHKVGKEFDFMTSNKRVKVKII
jgi:transcription elongation factor GreA